MGSGINMLNHSCTDERETLGKIIKYYQFQSHIYDATRWSFLFGRDSLLFEASQDLPYPKTITEFGCGTGRNLLKMSRLFPQASLTGIDISPEMLRVSSQRTEPLKSRIRLFQSSSFDCLEQKQDIILFAYCLSMINPNWEKTIQRGLSALNPGGLLAVVDFHASSVGLYREFMAHNHVSLKGEILPYLQVSMNHCSIKTKLAYCGLWSYFTFLGVN